MTRRMTGGIQQPHGAADARWEIDNGTAVMNRYYSIYVQFAAGVYTGIGPIQSPVRDHLRVWSLL